MLTGDKGETALEIGLRCGMYELETTQMLEIEGTNKGELRRKLANL